MAEHVEMTTADRLAWQNGRCSDWEAFSLTFAPITALQTKGGVYGDI